MGALTLLQHAGKKVRVICEECDLLRSFNGDELISQFGDMSMPSLLDPLRIRVGCEKPKAGIYNRCALSYYFTHDEWVREAGMVSRTEHEIALGKRICDLQEWEYLMARCQCGRRAKLNLNSLARRYGRQARLKELATKLLCQDCKKYDSVIEISSLPR